MLSACIKRAQGADKVIRSIERHAHIVRGAVRAAFREHRTDLKDESMRQMQLPKIGQMYIVYRGRNGRKLKRGRKHRASSRNEPFAWLSGDTFRSMMFRQYGWNHLRFGFQTFQGAFWERNAGRTVLHKARVAQHRNLARSIANNIMRDIASAARGR